MRNGFLCKFTILANEKKKNRLRGGDIWNGPVEWIIDTNTKYTPLNQLKKSIITPHMQHKNQDICAIYSRVRKENK